MEKISNLFKKTETDIEHTRKFENLEEELLDYQFQYVEKLEKGELVELKDEEKNEENISGYRKDQNDFKRSLKTNFEKNLFKYTSFYRDSLNEYEKRFLNDNDKFEDTFRVWFRSILTKINDDYISGNKRWKENVFKILNDELEKLAPIVEVFHKSNEENSEEKNRAGLINFNLDHSNKLSNFGIDKNDVCLSIHFQTLSKQKAKNEKINNIFFGNSFQELAVKIVNEYPQVKAILAKSWLLDSPIAKRAEFNILKKDKTIEDSPSSWGQFVDLDGKINKERMQKFLETGTLEFFPTEGFIKIKDFLQKYLPEEYKGKTIKLKEITEESKKFYEQKNKVLRTLDGNFSTLTMPQIELLLNHSVIADFMKTNEGIELLGFIKQMKDKDLKNMNEFKSERFSQLKDIFNKYAEEKQNQYIEKEVFIS